MIATFICRFVIAMIRYTIVLLLTLLLHQFINVDIVLLFVILCSLLQTADSYYKK